MLAALSEHEMSFYSTVAQVAPVLLLTIVLEIRFGKVAGRALGPRAQGLVTSFVVLTVVLVAGAEISAIEVLRTGATNGATRLWASLGFYCGFVALMIGVFYLVGRDSYHPPRRS